MFKHYYKMWQTHTRNVEKEEELGEAKKAFEWKLNGKIDLLLFWFIH